MVEAVEGARESDLVGVVARNDDDAVKPFPASIVANGMSSGGR